MFEFCTNSRGNSYQLNNFCQFQASSSPNKIKLKLFLASENCLNNFYIEKVFNIMKIILAFVVILVYFYHSSALELKCDFKHEVFFDDPKISYTCFLRYFKFATNLTFRTVGNVQGVSGNSHNEVTQIHISEQKMEYLPIGLTRFFKRLVSIHAGRNQLRYLVKEDLKEFRDLRFLYLYDNDLEDLKSDVFEHAQKLEYISLHSNRLVHIGAKILLPLRKLKTAYFNRNICIDKQAKSDEGMSDLRLEIAERCSEITNEDLMNTLKQNQAKIEDLQAIVKVIGEKLSNFIETFSEGNKKLN